MASSGSSREPHDETPWPWDSIVKFCSDHIPGMPGYTNSNAMAPSRGILTIDQARQKQDAALRTLRLHRYKIPEDGNCMFRAVASQLKRDQDKYHPIMREAASNWAADHIEELLASGLLDGTDEVQQMRLLGSWVGQAALVALCNVLGVNIAVVQGGDTGEVDIQHITPFETHDESPRRSIVLAYLYSGHYDAASSRDDQSNPEYARWQETCRRRDEASERLAKRLADSEVHPQNADKASVQLARRLADEEAFSQQEVSEQLALRRASEESYSQHALSSQPTSTSVSSSTDSVTNDHSRSGTQSVRQTRTMTGTPSQHDRPERREVDTTRGTRHDGREFFPVKYIPAKLAGRKSSRPHDGCDDDLPDENIPSVRGSRTPGRDTKPVRRGQTDRREVVPTQVQARTQTSRQRTHGHRSDLDNSDFHSIVRPIVTGRDIESTHDRNSGCSYVRYTTVKLSGKKSSCPYNGSDDDLPEQSLSSVRGSRTPDRDARTVRRRQTHRREVVPTQVQTRTQTSRQRTSGRRNNSDDFDFNNIVRPIATDRDVQSIIDNNIWLK